MKHRTLTFLSQQISANVIDPTYFPIIKRHWLKIIVFSKFQFCKVERVLEVNGADGCTTV